MEELCQLSPEFETLWQDNEVSSFGEGIKQLQHPVLGPILFEFSSFAVDGRPDLSLFIYNPVTRAEAGRVRSLMASQAVLPEG